MSSNVRILKRSYVYLLPLNSISFKKCLCLHLNIFYISSKSLQNLKKNNFHHSAFSAMSKSFYSNKVIFYLSFFVFVYSFSFSFLLLVLFEFCENVKMRLSWIPIFKDSTLLLLNTFSPCIGTKKPCDV